MTSKRMAFGALAGVALVHCGGTTPAGGLYRLDLDELWAPDGDGCDWEVGGLPIEDPGFAFVSVGPDRRWLTWAHEGGTVACALDDPTFTCEATGSVSKLNAGSGDATVSVSTAIAGTWDGDTKLSGTMSRTDTCDGVGCDGLGAAASDDEWGDDFAFPCTMRLDFEGTRVD